MGDVMVLLCWCGYVGGFLTTSDLCGVGIILILARVQVLRCAGLNAFCGVWLILVGLPWFW